jgi:hypothetical protein
MNFGYWCENVSSTFWIFPLLCMVFMVAMMIMVFRSGCCMPIRRGRAGSKSDSAKSLPFSERSEP